MINNLDYNEDSKCHEESNLDSICSICYTQVINEYYTECNHVFCIECILKWSNINFNRGLNSSCPMCRCDISNEKIKIALSGMNKSNISPDSVFSFDEFVKLKGVRKVPEISHIILNMDPNECEWEKNLKDVISETRKYNYSERQRVNERFDLINLQINNDYNIGEKYNICLQIYDKKYCSDQIKLSNEVVKKNRVFWVYIDQRTKSIYETILNTLENIVSKRYPGYEFIEPSKITNGDCKLIKLIMPDNSFQRIAVYDYMNNEVDIEPIPFLGTGNFSFFPKLIIDLINKKTFVRFTIMQIQIK